MLSGCRSEALREAAAVRTKHTGATDSLWFKHAVIYNLDVGTFRDSDGDGRGDFKGLSSRLGYLDSLGVTTLWLSPFFESPGLDDGYDVTNYFRVDPKLGTLDDFRSFIKATRSRQMRVITDLVINHTSKEHPWFRAASGNPASPYRDWYVWSKTRPRNRNEGMVFPGVQKSIWSYDSLAGAYYYHRFYEFQPDLNAQNPSVQAAMKAVIRYWIAEGLDGFRLDGVPFYIEVPQNTGDDFPRQYQMLTKLRHYTDSLRPGAVILGEANVLPEETLHYFGRHGERMQMMFNFYANQQLFLALATGDGTGLSNALNKTRDIPAASQWAFFLRNHDEVDLGRLSRRERQKVYAAFGPDPDMQLYDRGIRRRLAPMLGNPAMLRMAYALLFAMPGTPVIRYGDEISMGDDLRLKERLSVRTPMQWSAARNAGFSSGVPFRPVIDTGRFSYQRTNVEAALRDSSSLYHWIATLIRRRQQCTELRSGAWSILQTGNDHVLALQYTLADTTLIVLNNLRPDAQQLRAATGSPAFIDVLGARKYFAAHGHLALTLSGYESRWLRNAPLR